MERFTGTANMDVLHHARASAQDNPAANAAPSSHIPDAGLPHAPAPIRISSFEELGKIGAADGYPLDGRYELTADIDASPSREQPFFTPIGTRDNPFTGVFDGKNHCINGLNIDRHALNSVGLFGYAQNAEIRRVRLNAESVKGGLDVGALVGYAEFTIIENCRTTGCVSGLASVGGLVGSASASTISKCFSSCECYSAGYRSDAWHWSSIGGLVGHAQGNSIIAESCAAGNVAGVYNNVGGLLGFAGSVDISRCYSTGSVKGGYNDVGGFVGNIANTMGRVTISNCYSTGSVKGSDSLSVGGFVGNVDRGDSHIGNCYSSGGVTGGSGFSPPIYYDMMSGCFWDFEASKTSLEIESDRVAAKSTAEMRRRATFAGWDFDAVWTINEGNDYPVLRGVGPTASRAG